MQHPKHYTGYLIMLILLLALLWLVRESRVRTRQIDKKLLETTTQK